MSSAWTPSVPVGIPGTGLQVYILFCVDNHEDQRKTCRSRHTNTVFGQQEVLLAEYGEDDLLHETCHFVKKWSKDPQRPERGKESHVIMSTAGIMSARLCGTALGILMLSTFTPSRPSIP